MTVFMNLFFYLKMFAWECLRGRLSFQWVAVLVLPSNSIHLLVASTSISCPWKRFSTESLLIEFLVMKIFLHLIYVHAPSVSSHDKIKSYWWIFVIVSSEVCSRDQWPILYKFYWCGRWNNWIPCIWREINLILVWSSGNCLFPIFSYYSSYIGIFFFCSKFGSWTCTNTIFSGDYFLWDVTK